MEIRNDLEKDEDKFVLNYDPTGKHGNLTFVQNNAYGTFNLEGNAKLLNDPFGGNGDYPDYTEWTVAGTVTMKTPSVIVSGTTCMLQSAEQVIPEGVVFRVWKKDPPTAWFFGLQMTWGYQCVGGGMVHITTMFNTRTGEVGGVPCGQVVEVPVDDVTSPAGSFTMDCLAAWQPTIGTVTGTWAFQP